MTRYNADAALQQSIALDPTCTRDLSDQVLDGEGVLRVLPAAFWAQTTVQERVRFCVTHGYYGLPTEELVAWLQARIAGRRAIEIGAGAGVLAAALGIPATDNHLQSHPEVRKFYADLEQPTIQYGAHVQKLEAHRAVARLRPQVVIASWVTHRYEAARPAAGGNMYGPNEGALIDAVEDYIFIGNTIVHAAKPIWARPHELIHPDWLYSRAHNGSPEFIAIWPRGKHRARR